MSLQANPDCQHPSEATCVCPDGGWRDLPVTAKPAPLTGKEARDAMAAMPLVPPSDTPETDAFMTLITDDDIDLGQVEAKLRDMERERNRLRADLQYAKDMLAWAEAIICNAVHPPHSTAEEWDSMRHTFREQLHKP